MKDPIQNQSLFTPLPILLTTLALTACNWVDSAGRQGNAPPEIRASIDDTELTDQQAIAIEDSGSLDLDFSQSADSDGYVVAYSSELIDQGKLQACEELIQLQDAADLIENACDADVSPDECSLTILNRGEALGDAADSELNADSRFTLLPPPLAAPIGLTYRWTAEDNDGGQTAMDLTFCLESADELPVANDDTYHLAYNAEIEISGAVFDESCELQSGSMSLLANDEDNLDNGSCIQAELISLPLYAANDFGSEFNAAGGFRYVHNGLYDVATDSFSYRLTDGDFQSEPATVYLDINIGSNLAPIANDDSYKVSINSQNNLLDVTANDTDPELYPLTISSVGVADQGGTVTIASDGLIYSPLADFTGIEAFSYSVTDAGNSSSQALVTVNVSDVNTAPTAVDDAVTAVASDWTFFQVLENDFDPDQDDELRIIDITRPDRRGKLVIDASGQMVIYRARTNFSGLETFTYTIADNDGETSTATVSVTVTPKPD